MYIKKWNDNYLIDSNGGVYSCARLGTKGGKVKWKYSNGYAVVMVDYKKWTRVHRMVAEAFIPNPENKPEVNHKDGNKYNNAVDNLEWVTSAENRRHAIDTGLVTFKKGVNSPITKLNAEQRQYIIKNYKPNDRENGARALGKRFGVAHKTILQAIKSEYGFRETKGRINIDDI